MHVRMIQHAVGQGGLFSGTLQMGNEVLRWAYDCGSNQSEALARGIGQVEYGGKLDFLFVSHLDSDHINGLDRLLGACRIEEIVLPYFEDEVLLAIAARDARLGRLGGLFLEALPDLAGWFISRGVERVTFVRPGDGDEPEFIPDLGPRGFGPLDGPDIPGLRAKWLPAPHMAAPRRQRLGFLTKVRPGQIQEVAPEAVLDVHSAGGPLDWVLIPHVHPASAALLNRFRAALIDEFGQPFDSSAIGKLVRDPVNRKRLRSCYDALWLDHNLVSMTLYCGPIDGTDWRARLWRPGTDIVTAPAGWLLTGDAHLDGKRRRRQFFRRYHSVLENVGTLMLPHHGSLHNFDPALLTAIPALRVAFAAAGPNSYGHPHKLVKRAVRDFGATTFHRVSSKHDTTLVCDAFVE